MSRLSALLASLALILLASQACGDEGYTPPAGDGVEKLGHFCQGDQDCDGGRCEGVMCVLDCNGPDFDRGSCPEGALCHDGRCHLTCDSFEECPLDTDPGPPTTGGYRCSGPNDDFSEGTFTCFLNPEDPGG